MCIAASSSYTDGHLENYGRMMRIRSISSGSARSYGGQDSVTSEDSRSSTSDLSSAPDSAEILFGR